MVRVLVTAAAVLLPLAVVCSQSARDPRFFHTRNFWDGFESGLSEAGVGVQKRLHTNLEKVLDGLNNMGDSLGSFSKRIEDQVQDSMPAWIRSPLVHRPLGPQSAPVEAIIGSLGGHAVDDGLKVYFDEDIRGGDEPEPHIIPKSSYDNFMQEAMPQEEVFIREKTVTAPTPQTSVHLFDLGFGFGDRFRNRLPIFPVFGGSPFSWTTRVQPWWKGQNVCMEETEINVPDQVPEANLPAEDADEQAAVQEAVAEERAAVQEAVAEQQAAVQEAVAEIQEEIQREEIPSSSSAARAFLSGAMTMKSCSTDQDKYTCTTRTRQRGVNRTVRRVHRCCHGFLMKAGICTRVNILPMSESLKGLELTDFLSMVKSAGALDLIDSQNLTLFVPSNEAMQDYTADITERNDIDITDNEVYRRKRSTDEVTNVILSHITEGIVYAGDMEDEKIISSMMEESTLRLNVYRTQTPPILTVNCARLITVNQPSSNGIIHTIDRIVKPATRSIGDMISNDPQFTTLKKLVSSSGLLQQLRDPGQLTMFAPTDAAFATALPEEEIEALIEGSSCLPAILKNHLLPNVICSSAITNPQAKTLNLLEKYLKVRLQDSGKVFVEDAQIVAKDIMATNGVIHIIDAPLIPSEAKSVLEVLESQNLTSFLELLKIAELTKELDELEDIAIFAPNNEAIDKLDEDYLNELMADRERLRRVLRHHVTASPDTDVTIGNNHMTATQAGSPLRMNVYAGTRNFVNLWSMLNRSSRPTRLTANCARVTLLDARTCGAAVHVVDNLLEPTEETVMRTLERDPHFSIFTKIAMGSSLAEELSRDTGSLTVLAPSDHVFRTLPEEELNSLLEDKELMDELVKRHTLRELVCCAGISPYTFMFRDNPRTVHGSPIHIHQSPNGLLKAGPARITKCATPSHNGLVHTVNRLFVAPHVVDSSTSEQWGSGRPNPVLFPLPIFSLKQMDA